MAFFRRLFSLFGGGEKPVAREAPQVLSSAEQLRRAGRYDEAAKMLERASAASPGAVGLHVALGRVLSQAERYDEAAAALENALRLDRENLVAIRQLADVYVKRGEKVEALKKLKLYRGLKPGDRDVTELIDRLAAELRPTAPTAAATPRELTTAPIAPPGPKPTGEGAEAPPDTAPIVAPPAAAPPDETRHDAAQGLSAGDAGETREITAMPAPPAVTETLADLYRRQGYAADARAAYEALAGAEQEPERRRALKEKADSVSAAPLPTAEARLRAWLARLPEPAAARVDDIGGMLRELVARTEGVRAAALTDLEGLPVVSAGAADAPELEVLIAELTTFWKGVGRIDGEIGTGALAALSLSASAGAAVVSSVSPEYALIVHVAAGAPLGRIRYEASRTAWLLGPALR
jgi:tetratricopeptide (TPR) repeat protein